MVGAGSLWPNFGIIEVNFSKAKNPMQFCSLFIFQAFFFVTLEISLEHFLCDFRGIPSTGALFVTLSHPDFNY
jgi:hypothetical protein